MRPKIRLKHVSTPNKTMSKHFFMILLATGFAAKSLLILMTRVPWPLAWPIQNSLFELIKCSLGERCFGVYVFTRNAYIT